MTVDVPSAGPVQLGDVLLPDGIVMSGWNTPALLWATREPVPQPGLAWLAVHEMAPRTGLVPILLGYQDSPGDGRPWDNEEFDDVPDLTAIDLTDPAEVIRESWDGSIDPDDDDPEQLEQFAPFGFSFPGLAPGQPAALASQEVRDALGSLPPARIGLIPADSPADVLLRIGFAGAVNRYGTADQLSAVLRSWESRFDAVLLEVGFAYYRLLVRRPPRTRQEAEAVAAEIWAMSDEFWPTGPREVAGTTVGEIAGYITGTPFWALWLD